MFSPVVRYSSIRTLLAIANQYDMEIHQIDVISAYLNGVLEDEIYMKQPPGYVDPKNPTKVCRLRKSSYGLKQSARCWNASFDEYLKSEGYLSCPTDYCVYSKTIDESIINILIALFVDDTIIICNNADVLKEVKQKLNRRYEMQDQGRIHYFLGMSIKRDRAKKILTIDQSLYIEKVLRIIESESPVDVTYYQAAIGSLIYAAISTRPDISVVVGLLSQFMTNPGKEHWNGVKRVLRYLKGTLTLA